ncbi:Cyclin-like protein [Pseudocohnilembus persalinus]|uniref:Cyclin-like protein n=1 Tax=Pseudocohnilembus persalinus TaxID=266149 RepID=A0A0V0QBR7_PSEPJ|nr:Cyclin-like protein [Pseudocohnilembus persalinus]|eukprot:KRW99686.1 Cyclin-like protein [Pseudocohnilembus persalinus]
MHSYTSPLGNKAPYFKCEHQKTVIKSGIKNCFKCGVQIPDDKVKAYKTSKLAFETQFNPQKILKSIKKERLPQVIIDPSTEYYKQRGQIIEYMWDIAEKLRLSLNTTHLSIYFMDFVNSQVTIPSSRFNLYAATCVMLGAKSIELDERIPFISKLKRYSGIVHKTFEVSQAEGVIVQALKWNLQCVTPIDIIEFYVSQGVIFSNDEIISENQNNSEQQSSQKSLSPNSTEENPLQEKTLNANNILQENKQILSENKNLNSNQKSLKSPIDDLTEKTSQLTLKEKLCKLEDLPEQQVFQLTNKIEKEYSRLSNLIIRVAAASIAFLRKVCGVEQIWNQYMQKISGVSQEQFDGCYQKLMSKYQDYFVTKKKFVQKSNQPLKHGKSGEDFENQYTPISQQQMYSNGKNINLGLQKSESYNFDSQNLIYKNNSNNSNNSNRVGLQSYNNYGNISQGIKLSSQFSNNSNSNISSNQSNYNYNSNLQYQGYSGISTHNNNNGNNLYMRGQLRTTTQIGGQQSNQYNNRISSNNYIQKVQRVNSGIM